MQVKGFINVFKPLNMTSSDVVVRVRGMLGKVTGEKQKVGHLGTLDPLAVGVLPIALGNATRLFDCMQNKKKTYVATFKFGKETDTLDRGGKVIATCDKTVTENDVIEVLPQLIGRVMQMPPQYSAKSVNGRRAYDIAREGGIADLKPKQVDIYGIELLGSPGERVGLPASENSDYILSENEFAFVITCGSGTYIRAIARDMARLMGSIGYMSSLCRTESGAFSIDNAVTPDELETAPLSYLLPIDIALKDYDAIDLDEYTGNKALNGIAIACDGSLKSPVSVSVCGRLVGLGEVDCGRLRIKTRL